MFSQTLIRQLLRYLQMTALSAFLTLGVPVVLHEMLGIVEELAVAIGLVLAFFINFFSLRHYVFGSKGRAGKEFSKFLIFAAAFRLSEYAAFVLLHTMLGIFYVGALGAIVVISFALKFLCLRSLVFRGISGSPVKCD